VGVEVVQVPLPRRWVLLPDRVLLVGEDDLVRGVGGRVGAPDVEVAVRVVEGLTRLHEPGVLVRGVVDDQIGDHAHPPVLGRPDDLDDVAVGAEARVHPVEVGHVVAVVLPGGRVERHQPEGGHPQFGEVVDAFGEAVEVPHAVAVGVEERLDVEAVDDGVLVPEVGGVGDTHAQAPFRAGRTSVAATSSQAS